MKTRYSKPSADIAPESSAYLQKDAELAARQKRIAALLRGCPARAGCLICDSSLDRAEGFTHRLTDYLICDSCGHIQTRAQPPAGYPHEFEGGVSFTEVYPPLDGPAFESRRERIYRPKLDWILDSHDVLGRGRQDLINASWVELGSGAGYFLDALRTVGARNAIGLEQDPELARRANLRSGTEATIELQGSLATGITRYHADIYAAFFVLEHINNTREFFQALSGCPSGTLFAFAVPVFGFAALLETACDSFAARQLDSVVHTQLFTDRSIKYCLDSAGYDIAAQWVFGQDANDLSRMLLARMVGTYPQSLIDEAQRKVTAVKDAWQHLIDNAMWADSRHVLAVKT